VRAAPIGAFGAMAFTVGAFGVGSLVNLIELIARLIPSSSTPRGSTAPTTSRAWRR
jgi:Na+/serine symporter